MNLKSCLQLPITMNVGFLIQRTQMSPNFPIHRIIPTLDFTLSLSSGLAAINKKSSWGKANSTSPPCTPITGIDYYQRQTPCEEIVSSTVEEFANVDVHMKTSRCRISYSGSCGLKQIMILLKSTTGQ